MRAPLPRIPTTKAALPTRAAFASDRCRAWPMAAALIACACGGASPPQAARPDRHPVAAPAEPAEPPTEPAPRSADPSSTAPEVATGSPPTPPPPPPSEPQLLAVWVESQPAGARIRLDGAPRQEKTPTWIRVTPLREHMLTLELDGHEPAEVKFVVVRAELQLPPIGLVPTKPTAPDAP